MPIPLLTAGDMGKCGGQYSEISFHSKERTVIVPRRKPAVHQTLRISQTIIAEAY